MTDSTTATRSRSVHSALVRAVGAMVGEPAAPGGPSGQLEAGLYVETFHQAADAALVGTGHKPKRGDAT